MDHKTLSHLTSPFDIVSFVITQATVEQAMEKRSKDKFGPLGGKQLVLFIDDFNMPMRISHESPFQPPLELLRFWMDYGGW